MRIKAQTMVMALAAASLWAGTVSTSQAADAYAGTVKSNPWAGIQWLIRGRVIGMLPDENDGRLGGAAANLRVSDAVMPELDFSYFFNDNLAMELILATTPHDVSLAGTGKISKIWVLPPTLTFQYHHPMGAFKPYVGAGVNYTIITSSKATAAIGGIDKWDDAFGIALQAGFDYAVDDRWSVNFDIKKLWLKLDAKVTAASTPASVDLDPWIVGAGIGYRF